MSKNKLDFNGLETLITMIKDFVVKKLNIEVERSDNKYLPFTGGIMNGSINFINSNNRNAGIDLNNNGNNFDIGWNYNNRDGAGFYIRSTDYSSEPGVFGAYARNSTGSCDLKGYPDGRLIWNGKNILTNGIVGTKYSASWTATTSSANNTRLTNSLTNLPIGVYIVECKLPAINTGSFFMGLALSNISTSIDTGCGSMMSQQVSTKIVIVNNTTNSMYLTSGQSAQCNFSYLERGGLVATRIA